MSENKMSVEEALGYQRGLDAAYKLCEGMQKEGNLSFAASRGVRECSVGIFDLLVDAVSEVQNGIIPTTEVGVLVLETDLESLQRAHSLQSDIVTDIGAELAKALAQVRELESQVEKLTKQCAFWKGYAEMTEGRVGEFRGLLKSAVSDLRQVRNRVWALETTQ